MGDVLDVNILVYPLSTAEIVGDGLQVLVLKAPSDDLGGAIRIVDAYVVNGAATGAGTAWSVTLQNRGTTGVETATAVSEARGGTGDVFVANTPKQFTILDPILQAGEWLGFVKNETNSSDPVNASLVIHYLNGN